MAPLLRKVIVRNPEGLHLRPADLLVRQASKFQATIRIGLKGEWVDCNSILSLVTLGATQGTELTLSVEGADAKAALESIASLFEAGFEDSNEKKIDEQIDAKPAVDP
jgi:phosphocarrier protein HPr